MKTTKLTNSLPDDPNRTSGPILEERIGRFPERLREAVGKSSKRAFSHRSGVSPSVLSAYLAGKSEPTRPAVIGMADAAGVRVEWLATGEGPMRKAEPAERPMEGFSYIELVSVPVAAGAGAEVYTEEPAALIAFRTEWLHRELRANVSDLVAMLVQGESMEPTLAEGDLVLLDRSATNLPREGVYVLRMDNALMVKRLQRLPGNQIKASSDNPAYEPFIVPWPAAADGITIIGRVVWMAHRL